jgi:hypothetical protein
MPTKQEKMRRIELVGKSRVNYVRLIFAGLVLVLMFIGSSAVRSRAYAVTMETVLNPDSNVARLSYEELHSATINYPAGSQLAKLLGTHDKLIVTASSTNDTLKDNQEAMQNLVASINNEFRKHNSVVNAKSASLTITTEIKPTTSTSTILAQQVLMKIDIDGYVIPNNNINPQQQNSNSSDSHKYIDFNWRAFTVSDPLKITYLDNGTNSEKSIEANMLLDAAEGVVPGLTDALTQAGAGPNDIAFLQRPIIDFSRLSLSMDRWYVLFDPTASLRETEGYGFAGEVNGAKVDTIYSLGEGSIREGVHDNVVYNTSFGPNKEYSMEFTIPPPNSRIDVLGYSNMHSSNGQDTAVISNQNEGGSSYAGNFPFVVLGSLGGIMAAIVGFVLMKSRKEPRLGK